MLLLKGSLLKSMKNKKPENTETEIEMSNDIVYTDNPLQKVDKDQSASNAIETHNRAYELEMENAYLKNEITILQKKVKEFENIIENKKNDNKSADL